MFYLVETDFYDEITGKMKFEKALFSGTNYTDILNSVIAYYGESNIEQVKISYFSSDKGLLIDNTILNNLIEINEL